MISVNSKLIIPEYVIFNKENENKYVLVKTNSDELSLFELEDEGFIIWDFIIKDKSCKKLISFLKNKYEFTQENTQDVLDFISDLEASDLLIVES